MSWDSTPDASARAPPPPGGLDAKVPTLRPTSSVQNSKHEGDHNGTTITGRPDQGIGRGTRFVLNFRVLPSDGNTSRHPPTDNRWEDCGIVSSICEDEGGISRGEPELVDILRVAHLVDPSSKQGGVYPTRDVSEPHHWGGDSRGNGHISDRIY